MAEIKHRSDVGAVILRLLNGLKHTPQTIGALLGIDSGELERVIQGKAGLSAEIEAKLVSVRGINQREFYPGEWQHLFPVLDDTNKGVVICRKEDTVKSCRTITRGPDQVPYYIYADTAMSNLSSLRPEWIKQLYVNDGEDADSLPDWAFNKGHLEHQVTYFIGSVNFHWKDKNGKKYVRQTTTGDINYIVPFVPHSFTTRTEGEGLILAVTYGGQIARQDFRSKISSLDMSSYLRLAKKQHFHWDVGQHGVDILPISDFKSNRQRASFRFMNLVILGYQSWTQIALIKLKEVSFTQQSEKWGYNTGDSEIHVVAGSNKFLLKPGDSFFVKPDEKSDKITQLVRKGKGAGEILIVCPSPDENLPYADPYSELAMIKKYAGEEALKRVHTETTRWY